MNGSFLLQTSAYDPHAVASRDFALQMSGEGRHEKPTGGHGRGTRAGRRLAHIIVATLFSGGLYDARPR